MADIDDLLAAWASRAPTEDEVWGAARPGPSLAVVASRLSSVPRPFLDDRVSLRALSGDIIGDSLWCLSVPDHPRVRLGASLALWLVASEDVIEPFTPALAGADRGRAVDALALRLAPIVDPLDWISDDERREEAARTFLLWCGFLPAGESAATARSLFDARDSLRRNAALAEAYAEHRHRSEIARRLSDARAREAAARYTSE